MSEGLILAQRYRIDAKIGQGGMGAVYRAVDTQTGQPVAVKQLKLELTQNFPDVVERFIREGEALRRLNHPNIVKILDSVEQENTHWLIMEYVGGGSLRDLMDETPQLPVKQVLEIALDLSDALTRAHRLNIIHRDIKPANVLLATDGTPRLTDFGVAHFEDRTRVTSTGMVVGTFAYLSPEACRGEDLDPRTDIWSFGVMLYEMLAGKNPFERDSTAALLTAIVMDEPQPLIELRPEIPPALAALIHAMLIKEPDKRIQSVRQVGAALEEVLSKGHEATFTAHTRTSPLPPVAIEDEAETVLAQTPETPHQAMTPQPSATASSKKGLLLGLVFLTLTLLLGFAAVVLSNRPAELPAASPVSTSVDLEIALNNVPPVQEGKFLVLVADFERLAGEPRDIGRFIAEDLHDRLQELIPFSSIQVERLSYVITEGTEAHEIADKLGAAIVIWGNYDVQDVIVSIYPGSITPFPYYPFDDIDLIEQTAEVRLILDNLHLQSLAQPVLVQMVAFHLADGDGYNLVRALAMLDLLDATTGQIDAAEIPSQFHTAILQLNRDPQAAWDAINAAIELDSTNPLLYAVRALVAFRLENLDAATEDINTLKRFPDLAEHPLPEYLSLFSYIAQDLFFHDHETPTLTVLDRLIQLRPKDWYLYTLRGIVHYSHNQLDAAQRDIDMAMGLSPQDGLAHIYQTMIALQTGRQSEIQQWSAFILEHLTDTAAVERTLTTLLGSHIGNTFSEVSEVLGQLLLGQYRQAIQTAEADLTQDPDELDLYFLLGIAQCQIEEYAAAEEAFTAGLALSPNHMMLLTLRGAARLQLDDKQGAAEDFAAVQSMIDDTASQAFRQFLTMAQNGEIGCNLLP